MHTSPKKGREDATSLALALAFALGGVDAQALLDKGDAKVLDDLRNRRARDVKALGDGQKSLDATVELGLEGVAAYMWE